MRVGTKPVSDPLALAALDTLSKTKKFAKFFAGAGNDKSISEAQLGELLDQEKTDGGNGKIDAGDSLAFTVLAQSEPWALSREQFQSLVALYRDGLLEQPPAQKKVIDPWVLPKPKGDSVGVRVGGTGSPPAATPKQAFDRVERVELQGSVAQGTIINVKQFHKYPGMAAADLEDVTQYQLRVLDEFLDKKPTDVFVEGLTEDLPAKNRVLADSIGRLFLDFDPAHPQSWQRDAVLEYGAARIYAAMHPERVTLHATIQPAESAIVDGEISRGQNVGFNITTRREQDATQEVTKFLKSHPGASVVLLFGKAHDFAPYFRRPDFQPKFVSVSFAQTTRR